LTKQQKYLTINIVSAHIILSEVEGKVGDSVHGKEKEEEEINW
jgi:hypothetical protein